MNLPHHRRYNWGIMFKPHMRAIRLFIYGLILGLLIWLGELWYLQNHQLLLSQDNALLQATMRRNIEREVDRDYVNRFGAPCTTRTDREEGTCRVELRAIHWSGK